MRKIKFPKELSYIIGLLFVAFGVAFMARASLGMSMVVAPAYLISFRIEAISFGMAEYMFQAVLLVLLCVFLKRFKTSYLFSFVTAVLYGFMLDFAVWCISGTDASALYIRFLLLAAGILLTAVGVTFCFNTYFAPEVYELVVKVVSVTYGKELGKVKLIYDFCSLALSCVLSFALFGRLEGIGIGTVICALLNGFLIGGINKFLNRHVDFFAVFPIEKYFRID